MVEKALGSVESVVCRQYEVQGRRALTQLESAIARLGATNESSVFADELSRPLPTWGGRIG